LWLSVAAGLVFFLAGIFVTVHVSGLLKENISERHKQDALAGLAVARAHLEGEVEKIFALGRGVGSHISGPLDAGPTQQKLGLLAAELVRDNPAIRIVALAPGNVVRTIFPREPNETVIGLDYRTNAAQWPSVQEAMIRRSEVLSGPVMLVQGGRGLIARIPVYPAEAVGLPVAERRYWGVISIVIDEESLMKSAGLAERMGDYRLAIGAYGAGGEQAEFVYGDPKVLRSEAVALPLHLAGTPGWELMSYPVDGWRTTSAELWVTQLSGLLISILFALMAFFLMREVIRIRTMALHDALTGLANRRLLEERMTQLAAMCERSGKGFDIFYLDLDTFKPINDNLGHSTGDLLLIEIGQRLKRQTREMDTVARVGGDEFIVLTPGGMTTDERTHFAERLGEEVAEPFLCAGAELRVKASIGSASFPDDAGTVAELLRVADARMYIHKDKAAPSAPLLAGAASISG